RSGSGAGKEVSRREGASVPEDGGEPDRRALRSEGDVYRALLDGLPVPAGSEAGEDLLSTAPPRSPVPRLTVAEAEQVVAAARGDSPPQALDEAGAVSGVEHVEEARGHDRVELPP